MLLLLFTNISICFFAENSSPLKGKSPRCSIAPLQLGSIQACTVNSPAPKSPAAKRRERRRRANTKERLLQSQAEAPEIQKNGQPVQTEKKQQEDICVNHQGKKYNTMTEETKKAKTGLSMDERLAEIAKLREKRSGERKTEVKNNVRSRIAGYEAETKSKDDTGV